MDKPPKLVDVARMAKVDVATASRALNRGIGWERLSADCVERVVIPMVAGEDHHGILLQPRLSQSSQHLPDLAINPFG